MNQKYIPIILLIVVVVFVGVVISTQKNSSSTKSGISQETLVNPATSMTQPSEEDRQPFAGEKGQTVSVNEGVVSLNKTDFETNKVKFFNVTLEDGKTVYFLALKDEAGNFRIAANANEKCAPYGKGYKQEGDNLVCLTCGKSYPVKGFAIEQPDCNPKPLTAKAEVNGNNVNIQSADLQKLSYLFN